MGKTLDPVDQGAPEVPDLPSDPWVGLPRPAVLLLVAVLAALNLGLHLRSDELYPGGPSPAEEMAKSRRAFSLCFSGEDAVHERAGQRLREVAEAGGMTLEQVLAVSDEERQALADRLGVTSAELSLPDRISTGERLRIYFFGGAYWPYLRAAAHFAFILPVAYSSAILYGILVLLFALGSGGGTWHTIFMLVAMMSPLLDMVFLRGPPPLVKGQSLGQDAWRRIRKDRFAMGCLSIITLYACVALLCRIEVLAGQENEPVTVVRGAWVDGTWRSRDEGGYAFKAGENLPAGLREQAPTLEYQPPSIWTNIQVAWMKLRLTASGSARQEFREFLDLGPIPSNEELERQKLAYQSAVDEGREPPAITIPEGDYQRPGPDGLYPDERNLIPGWFDYPLGTDFLARDVFKRVLHGTRIAMSVGLVSCIIAIPIGSFFGALAGFYGGFVDELIVLLYSTIASVPGLLLLLAFVMVVGKGIIGVYIALGMTSWVSLCRLVRGEFIKHKEREYVVAAQSLGATNFSCIFKHILPNVFHILIINFSLRFVYAVQSEVILSYLGVGVNDQPSWGVMINDAKLELARGVWWQLAAATGAMFFIVLALNIFGDILRDALDPKLRK